MKLNGFGLRRKFQADIMLGAGFPFKIVSQQILPEVHAHLSRHAWCIELSDSDTDRDPVSSGEGRHQEFGSCPNYTRRKRHHGMVVISQVTRTIGDGLEIDLVRGECG